MALSVSTPRRASLALGEGRKEPSKAEGEREGGPWLLPARTSPADVRCLAVTLPVNLGGKTHLWQIAGTRVCRPSARSWA